MEYIKRFNINFIESLGKVVLTNIKAMGKFSSYIGTLFYWGMRSPYRHKLLWEQIYFIGNKSLFIIILTSSFSGMVFAYQTYIGFSVINADSFIGPIVAISVAKELAPVFTGLVVAGRCGAAMAAQIGTMKVTEQIDALECMGINSVQYLGVPRVLACMISMPLLAAIFILIANIGSWVIGVKLLLIDDVLYFSKLSDFMRMGMVYEGLVKSFVFGFLISVIGTYQGFQVKGGAEGVGKGTNLAVVWGMVMVLVVDFFLTSILTKIL
ncbi:ABC transporter permease [Bacteriovoracaceae bacterium]|nr:ABC transporter permease [Bacteriovoracaceae bacterium]